MKLLDFFRYEREFVDFVEGSLINEPYTFFNPINWEYEKKIFFEKWAKGKNYEPNFEYKKVDVEKYFEKLDHYYDLFSKIKNRELSSLYCDKINELRIFLNTIKYAGTKNFTKFSQEAYGKPNFFNYILARIVVMLHSSSPNENYISSKEISKLFTDFCEEKHISDWKLDFNDEIPSIAFINSKQRVLSINNRINHTKVDFVRLLRHEIGVHATRYYNGSKILSIFALGLARYDELEEGLATFNESGIKDFIDISYMPALKYIAVYHSLKNDFSKTYKLIYDLTGDKELSFSIVLRSKRGTKDNVGSYTKDALYFSGYLKVILLNIYGKSKMDEAFIGKIGFKDFNKIKKIMDYLTNLKTDEC